MSVSEWGGDSEAGVPGADVIASGSAAVDPEQSATASGHDDSGDLSGPREWVMVEALAALLEPEAFDPDIAAAPEWRERTKDTALAYAAKVITSGYRLVSEDDTTVDRVAAAIWHSDVLRFADLPPTGWEHVQGRERRDYLRIAAAAVRALREAGE